MSESGSVQGLTLPGLLSAFLVLGSGPGLQEACAASLHLTASSHVLSKTSLAQASEGEGEPEAEEEVPFSELNEALSAARSRLNELTKAAEIAKVAGELREKLQTTEAENRQLKSVLSQLQTENSDLHSAKQTAERQFEELEKVSESASAEARRLDEELVSMRWQNSQLSTSLARAETTVHENTEELGKVREELSARAEIQTAAADESATEIARLQRELDTAQERILVAERLQAESATELVELKQTAEDSTADSARLAKDLDGTITDLAKARTELVATEEALEGAEIARKAAEGETGVLQAQLASSRTDADQLRGRLETAESALKNSRTQNAGLERQVDLLKTAAGEATNAARQNLLAVEDQINEINAALASVKAEDLLPESNGQVIEDEDGLSPTSRTAANQTAVARPAADGWVPRPSPPRATNGRELIAAAAAETIQPSAAARNPLAGAAVRSRAAVETDDVAPAINLASLTTGLPANRRQDAEALLGKVKAEKDARGLSMAVPGELLFAVNSEQIEPAASDALANVASLVDLFDERNVLIVGHTDAVGDADYNQKLSERRAALVKEYFVKNFQISVDRLEIEGRGEQDPISSNATEDGRNANRRVEVVILN